jgi:hypothetical protein
MFSPFSVFSIGFSGSRSPSRASKLALCDLLPFVPPRCRRSGLAGDPALFPGLPGGSFPGAALLWGRIWFLGVRGLCSWVRAAGSALAPRLFVSPCLGWCRLGALGVLLVVGGSRSPPGSVISFLVLLYYARLFPPGICLIIPCYYAIIKA